MTPAERRVAVTGIGICSSLGAGREETWKALVEGRCGIRPVTLFDTSGYRSNLAAEAAPYPVEGFTRAERRHLSRSDQLGILAASEALDDSGLLASGIDRARVGTVMGSGTADLLRNEEYFGEWLVRGVDGPPLAKIFNHFTSTPSDAIASRFELTGLKSCMLSACSSSTVALGYAADAVRWGQLDAVLAGGSDVLCRLTLAGFNSLRLVSPEPCRPFDAARQGLNIGEAAAVLVLEELSRARRRGAPIYCELAGYGAACEAYHPTAPEPEGKAIAAMIRAALLASSVHVDEVDHINAHGTATVFNDRAEARAIHAAFGARGRTIPVTSIKSMVGHCLSAAGAIEAAALALTVARGLIPPTANHTQRDPECDLDVVAGGPRRIPVRCGVSLSLAFGGNDAALVMRAAS